LGAVGIIGFLAGINLIGSCVILLSLTTVNAWRNANDFRERMGIINLIIFYLSFFHLIYDRQ
jgi:hypothetical protein